MSRQYYPDFSTCPRFWLDKIRLAIVVTFKHQSRIQIIYLHHDIDKLKEAFMRVHFLCLVGLLFHLQCSALQP